MQPQIIVPATRPVRAMSSNIDQSLILLETAAKRAIPGRNAVKSDIENTIAACTPQDHAESRLQLDRCIRALGLIYVRATGKLPGYSNSDNTTHFERFLLQLDLPHHLLGTLNHIRTATRNLDAKHDPEFLAALAAATPASDRPGNPPG